MPSKFQLPVIKSSYILTKNTPIYSELLEQSVRVTLKTDSDDHLRLEPDSFDYPSGSTQNQSVVITGLNAGYVQVTASSDQDANQAMYVYL